MNISFHGADRGVTGSCHLIECAGKRILIDCGMYQGGRELREENADDFGFDPTSIDYVLLTHAHLDHCGRLPLLSKRGFLGEIITTSATRELARIVMLDSAGLQEEDAKYHRHRAERHGSHHKVEPLYTTLDALNSLEHFGRTAHYNQRLTLSPGIHATFYDAGHILGSASILLELEEGDQQRKVVFSGDLGNAGRPLLRDPVVPPKADIVVMETTYADRLHKPFKPSVDELYEAIDDTLHRGGNVIIPTFALERAQEILYFLREGIEQERLPPTLQVFLDSPMAISATKIFEHHPECYEADVAELFREGGDPFLMEGLHFTRETAESIALNEVSGAVIMAGSGMCTGGRVRHHLKHNLGRNNCSVVFVGYAAHGTLARRIIDGADGIHLFGDWIPVRASIHTINGFSAHADRDELLAWQSAVGAPRTFLVHGEEEVMEAFATVLQDTEVTIPSQGEQYTL